MARNKMIDALSAWDWDVGDQGEPNGFGIVFNGRAYQVVIEGWDLECVAGARDPIEAIIKAADRWRAQYGRKGFKTYAVPGHGVVVVTMATKRVKDLSNFNMISLK